VREARRWVLATFAVLMAAGTVTALVLVRARIREPATVVAPAYVSTAPLAPVLPVATVSVAPASFAAPVSLPSAPSAVPASPDAPPAPAANRKKRAPAHAAAPATKHETPSASQLPSVLGSAD
jgi:hypothetical protein